VHARMASMTRMLACALTRALARHHVAYQSGPPCWACWHGGHNDFHAGLSIRSCSMACGAPCWACRPACRTRGDAARCPGNRLICHECAGTTTMDGQAGCAWLSFLLELCALHNRYELHLLPFGV
jgi:hypothetical protein